MAYACSVTERYPDDTKWVHYFETKAAAVEAIEEMGAVHKGRTYEVTDLQPDAP